MQNARWANSPRCSTTAVGPAGAEQAVWCLGTGSFVQAACHPVREVPGCVMAVSAENIVCGSNAYKKRLCLISPGFLNGSLLNCCAKRCEMGNVAPRVDSWFAGLRSLAAGLLKVSYFRLSVVFLFLVTCPVSGVSLCCILLVFGYFFLKHSFKNN